MCLYPDKKEIHKMTSLLRQKIPVRHLISGTEISVVALTFKGTHNGPKAYIQSSTHGAELQGSAVIFKLFSYLLENPPLGDITLVPQANPYGSDVKLGEYTYGRFDPTTGENWNRCYYNPIIEDGIETPSTLLLSEFIKKHCMLPWVQIQEKFKSALIRCLDEKLNAEPLYLSYGQKLALTLQKLAYQADTVLDLHCDSISQSYVYVPSYAQNSAPYLHIPYMLLTPKLFTPCLNEASFYPWWALHDLLQPFQQTPHSFQSFTLELGNKEKISLDLAETQAQGILNYLRHRGTVSGSSLLPQKQPYLCQVEDFKRIYSSEGGLVDYQAELGKVTPQGSVLATLLKPSAMYAAQSQQECLMEIRAPEECIPLSFTSSSALHEGTEVVKFMTKMWQAS
jgi:predicted deacylase